MHGEVRIYRFHQDENQTTGGCLILNENKEPIFSAISLERGWLDNKPNESCIPVGEYDCVLEYSPRFKKELWELKGVPIRIELGPKDVENSQAVVVDRIGLGKADRIDINHKVDESSQGSLFILPAKAAVTVDNDAEYTIPED